MRTCSSGITEATTTSAPARVSVSVMHEVSISSLSSATGTSTVRRLACACMHTLDVLVRLSAGAAARATRPRASVVWARSSAVRPSIAVRPSASLLVPWLVWLSPPHAYGGEREG